MMLPDYGVDKYDIGTGFGHFGIAVDDVSYYFFLPFYIYSSLRLAFVSFLVLCHIFCLWFLGCTVVVDTYNAKT